jgi:hypothetical protein
MSTPDPTEFLLPAPDPDFHLSEMQRTWLPAQINASALQQLLARIRPEHRGAILDDLRELGAHTPVAFGPMMTTIPDADVQALVKMIFPASRLGGSRGVG